MAAMLANNAQEEAKLAAMQRAWQPNRRLASALSLFDEEDNLEELFATSAQTVCDAPSKTQQCAAAAATATTSATTSGCSRGYEPEPESEPKREQPRSGEQEPEQVPETDERDGTRLVELDASKLNDFPARYTIRRLDRHQFPAVGVYVDERILPGFKYRVRPLPDPFQKSGAQRASSCLFEGRALALKAIGRGYARRFTFEDPTGGDEHFWSDNRPEGYAFEVEAISDGDKFTVFDANREPQGTAEVLNIEGPQTEISGGIVAEGVEKRLRVKFIGKVELFETGVAKPTPLTGVAVCLKRKGASKAEVARIVNVTIDHRRYYFKPGLQKNHRRVTVRGEDIGDVPTKYSMTGLEPYEIPVVGTYVDPRVIPGFHYRVRPNDRRAPLFGGRALQLQSVGMGYAKRLTFRPDCALEPNNFLWSDSHPDGLGLEPRAVHAGMQFAIVADGHELGEASVFRTDTPQVEERMEHVSTESGRCAVVKYIHVNVMCHVRLTINGTRSEEHLMRVYGLAVVRKEPLSSESRVLRVENVALDSQLNLLFARTHTELTFVPV